MHELECSRLTDVSSEAKTDPSHKGIPRARIAWRLAGLLFVLSIVTLVAVNYPALSSPMIYDSHLFILAKSDVFQRSNVWDVVSIIPVRPLLMVSFYLNYLTTGMDTAYFRLVNIVLAAASGAALALMIFLILDLPVCNSPCSSTQKFEVSLLLGFVFAIHPLQTLVTLYIWQREAILACLFYFSTVAVYVATRSGRFRQPTRGYVVTSLLFFAGMLCKENVATVPATLLLAEAALFGQDMKHILRRAIRISVLTLPPLLLYLAAANALAGSESQDLNCIGKRLAAYYEYSGLSVAEVLLTECRAVFSYVASILAPVPGEIALVKAMIISRSLLAPPVTVVACAGITGMIGLAIFLLRRSPVTAFGILFFVITLIPESVLIPLYLFCGYRAILPMAGLLLILGEVCLWVLTPGPAGSGARARTVSVGLFLTIALAGLLASDYSRATSWNPLYFWKEAYDNLPASPASVEKKPYLDIISSLSGALAQKGEYSEAAGLCQEALAIYPNASGIRDHLGVALLHSGRVQQAIEEFQKALLLQPDSVEAFNNMGNALLAANRISEAIESYRSALKLKPTRVHAYLNLGAAYLRAEQYQNARDVLEQGIAVDPEHAKARANLGIVLVKLGLFPEAIKQLDKAVRIDPGLVLAHLHLGIAWEQTGDTGRAVQSYSRAVERAPTFLDARSHLAKALVKLEEYPQAVEQYQIILRIDPKNYRAHNDLAYALIAASQFDRAVDHCRKALSLKPDFAEAQANLKLALRRGGVGQNRAAHPHETVQPRSDRKEAEEIRGIPESAEETVGSER